MTHLLDRWLEEAEPWGDCLSDLDTEKAHTVIEPPDEVAETQSMKSMIYRQSNDRRWCKSILALAMLLAVLGAIHPSTVSAADGARKEAAGAGKTEIKVSVPYITNRRLEEDGSGSGAYGGERGSSSLGRCEVAFSPIPVIDRFVHRVPFYIPDETREVRPGRYRGWRLRGSTLGSGAGVSISTESATLFFCRSTAAV